MPNIMLSWSDDFIFWIVEELAPMSKPSDTSWNHEKNWEHVSWESHCFVNDSAVEINVRVKFSVNEIRVT